MGRKQINHKHICKNCNNIFIDKLKRSIYCSRKCMGKYRKNYFCHSQETKYKLSLIKKGQYKNGLQVWNKGKPNPLLSIRQRDNNVSKRPEVRIKLSLARKKYYSQGNKPWNWNGGNAKNRKYLDRKSVV